METKPIIQGVVRDLIEGEAPDVISGRFHNTLVKMLHRICMTVRTESGISQVVLSGGVFQNETLLSGLTKLLGADGFEILSHAQVPANDGGLSLGQAVIAGMLCAGHKGQFEETYEIHG